MELITAEWFSAAAALGALIAAGIATVGTWRQVRIERARDRIDNEREFRSQATVLASWSVYCDDDPSNPHGVLLRNASSAPFYDVELSSTISQGHGAPVNAQPTLHLSLLPPGEFVVRRSGKGWGIPVERSSQGRVTPIMRNATWAVTSVTFSDADGARWRRAGSVLEHIGGVEGS